MRRCIERLPDLQERLRTAHRVLLKPNLLSSSRGPEAHVNTHPAVVQALAEVLAHEFGCDVAIGDSCGTLGKGCTATAIERSQMDEAARAAGAAIYNVDTQPRQVLACDGAKVFKQIPLPSNLGEFDLVIPVAKLKTHGLTCVTGPVKNMYGLVPGAGKKQGHLLAPKPQDFAVLLCDLYAVLRPGAAFVDGVVGMEGRGPANGPLRHMELLAASCDPVALDSFCAQVMGFDPFRVPVLAECHRRQLGVVEPGRIVARGEPASAFAPPDFAKPPVYATMLLLRMVPQWLCRAVVAAAACQHAEVDQAKCQRCGACAENCPSEAISRDEGSGRYQVDARKCIACYCCAEVCPYDAILMRGAWPREGLSRLKRLMRRP